MYNPNFGYSPASSHHQPTSPPFSSTPSNVRPQRPRFGYSGPPAYPRPRSSASKPNPDGCLESLSGQYEYPDGYSESLRSQYEYPEDNLDNMRSKYPIIFDYGKDSEKHMNSFDRSIYESVSDDSMNVPPRNCFVNSDGYVDSLRGTTDSMVNNYGNSNNPTMDSSFLPRNDSFYSNNNSSTHSQNTTSYFTCNESFYESPKRHFLRNSPTSSMQYPPSQFPIKNSGYNADNRPDFQGQFQNKKDKFKANSSLAVKSKPIYSIRRRLRKKAMASKSEWHCPICSIDFTSSIPYEMHLRGAKHAKKLKLQNALQSIQSQVAQSKEIAPVGNSFRCELCNVTANSTLQLQTHLDGTKHKNKLLQQQQSTEIKKEAALEVNGKSNGASVVRPLPSDFGEPQQAKMCKFSCETCNLIVNSEIQLQQHLTSKKHQAKVEGKPYTKKKFKRKKDDDENEGKTGTEQKTDDNAVDSSAASATTTQEPATGEVRKMVVGVKTLSASFVHGDTLH